MEKINSKRKNELKAKITDQGDIINLEDKSLSSRLSNGLYLADRGDSKKILLKARTGDKPNTKLNADKHIFKPSAPDKNALGDKDFQSKFKTDETIHSKPINVRSRVKTYIQNLKLYSDLKSKDIKSSNVFDDLNLKLEKTDNVANVMKPKKTPNVVQNDTIKYTLAKTNVGNLISNEFEKCNKEGNKSLSQDDFVDSTVESQINEILRFKQTKKSLRDNDHCRKVHIKLDTDQRMKIKEKHGIKSQVSSNLKESSPQNDAPVNKRQSKEILDSKSVSTRTKDSLKKSESSRCPVITTIRSKHNTKVYKAVTFTELKQREITPIEIKIPIVKRKEKAKTSDKNTDISSSSKEKKKKVFRKKRHIPSPDLVKKGESPPTEVAKWAPSCVNKLTIPYYEAWIDTTLAAISKRSQKDKMMEKQNFLKSFKKFLERPQTPDLVYDRMDEKYTGKIKIKQRNKNNS